MFDAHLPIIGQKVQQHRYSLAFERIVDALNRLTPHVKSKSIGPSEMFQKTHLALSSSGQSLARHSTHKDSPHWAPIDYEMVLSVRGSQIQFGLLTQGLKEQQPLKQMTTLVEATLDVYLSTEQKHDDALLLADLIKVAFPDPNQLRRYRPGTQSLLMGFVLSQDELVLKPYFNTRLFLGDDHQKRIIHIGQRLDIDTSVVEEIYPQLYNPDQGARFAGVGVDFGSQHKLKLYVRVPTDRAQAYAKSLMESLQIKEPSRFFVEDFVFEHLADAIEIGVACRAGGEPSLKWTFLFPSGPRLPDLENKVFDIMQDLGCDLEATKQCFEALGGHTCTDNIVHALGLEFPHSNPPKANIYMRPSGQAVARRT
jgi:hypothetical protein